MGKVLMLFDFFLLLLSLVIVDFDVLEVGEKVVQLIGVDKWFGVSFDSQFVLARVEEMAKIDVEKTPCVHLEQEIGWVTVSDAQDVSGYTLAG